MYTAPGLTYEAAEADPRSHIYPPAYHDAGRTEKDSIWTRHSRHATSSRSGLRCCVTMQIESPEGHSDHPLHGNNKFTGQHWGHLAVLLAPAWHAVRGGRAMHCSFPMHEQ